MARPSPRLAVLTTFVVFVLAFIFLFQRQPLLPQPREGAEIPDALDTAPDVSSDTLKGEAIMAKLGNETLKAELGRAAWKVIHTTMARFPDQPSQDEKEALKSYILLFARLYPWYAGDPVRLPRANRTQWRVCSSFPTNPQEIPSSSWHQVYGGGMGLSRTQ